MLLCISGSLRRESFNTRLLADAAQLYGGDHTMADIRFPLYDGDQEASDGIPAIVQDVADQIARAQAVVIATPEYNQSLSGVLKNALDWISRVEGNPWLDKPVALVAAAAGRAGGARAAYALRLAMTPFQPRLLTGPEVLVAGAAKEFGPDGRLTEGRYRETLDGLMTKLRAEAER